ncbi:LysM peptidoglycan-binding domain-containing protein [Sulfuriroseicoccus oceanibius]|uniref:LysM peptidoglycan-binding domain-containing protein n=1 Tax=Sulfuriroseicoccus oceanibius TaxID=2707525 RepID=A0A6B3LAV8_9BACT|nr:LysM peptidoglycan-binding domain-containing protein [Sulfuriroseicoccus oceanibius]QQL44690.1 LysM peptidoglycan-binding domain-containing protein [Sulfuriroseicoccus oceanibius]
MKNPILMTVGAVSAAMVMVSCQGTGSGNDVADGDIVYPFDENGNYIDDAASDAAGWGTDGASGGTYQPTTDLASNDGGGYSPPATPPSYSPPAQSTSYTVVRGDSLWKISRKFGVSVGAIQRANGISGSNIQIGQTLKIPGVSSGSGAVVSSSSGSVHTVRSGETLWGISRKYGVTVSKLKSANGLSSDTLRIGQSLQIP